MMKKMWLLLVGGVMSLLFLGCGEYLPPENQMTMVTDLKRTRTVYELEFNRRGILTKYGNTDIRYDGRRVILEEKVPVPGCKDKTQTVTTTFYPGVAGAYVSKSLCSLEVDEVDVPVDRTTRFWNSGDTLTSLSVYLRQGDGEFICRDEIKYIYDYRECIAESIRKKKVAGKEEEVFHNKYTYKNNIQYDTTLDLQAYVVEKGDKDVFFYMLLGLSEREVGRRLPGRLYYHVDDSTRTYSAEGVYRQIGYYPDKIEVISEDIRLLARYEIEFGNIRRRMFIDW